MLIVVKLNAVMLSVMAPHRILIKGATTLSITSFSITTLSITSFSITTLSITIFCIITLNA